MDDALPPMRSRLHRLWTQDDVTTLVAMVRAGSTATDIAAVLDRTRHSVKHKAQELGHRFRGRRFWTRAEDRALRAGAGTLTSAELGRQLGRSAKSVQIRAAYVGVSLARSGERHHAAKATDAQIEHARTLSDAGLSGAEIARRLALPIHNQHLNACLRYSSRAS